jgi:hypothetical protein
MASCWVGLPQAETISVSVCVALCLSLPDGDVSWFVTGFLSSAAGMSRFTRGATWTFSFAKTSMPRQGQRRRRATRSRQSRAPSRLNRLIQWRTVAGVAVQQLRDRW